jgi:CheY-like chemotaxis protein
MNTHITILLIDDDPINNIVNNKLLKKFNPSLEIVEFLSARKALQYLLDNGSSLPNIILLDINMPEMNGWEFLKVYQPLNLYCKLFLLTSSIAHEDIKQSKEYPVVQGFLTKPLEDDKIRKIFD